VRIFVDAGEGMAHLLAKATAKGIAVDYCRQLLQAFEGGSAGDGTDAPQPLLEPLSERELEVLRLIGEGLSNREIAARLVISLSTVKGHTANIYGKLGVHRRTLAVARARELGLLSS
jgi:LuxR family maltose regulon positive regulatory protein